MNCTERNTGRFRLSFTPIVKMLLWIRDQERSHQVSLVKTMKHHLSGNQSVRPSSQGISSMASIQMMGLRKVNSPLGMRIQMVITPDSWVRSNRIWMRRKRSSWISRERLLGSRMSNGTILSTNGAIVVVGISCELHDSRADIKRSYRTSHSNPIEAETAAKPCL